MMKYGIIRLNYIGKGGVVWRAGFDTWGEAADAAAAEHYRAPDEAGNNCVLWLCEYASRLDLIRQAAGMTQHDLADEAGVSFRTIQDYCQGQKKLETAGVLRCVKMARALGCKVEDIIEVEYES